MSSPSSIYSQRSDQSSSATPQRRLSPPPGPGINTFLADPGNAELLRPVPPPNLVNPLAIGDLISTDLEETEQAYERFFWMRELNAAARQGRWPFYEEPYGWLPIYFNVYWAKFLKLLGNQRLDDPEFQKILDSSADEEAVLRAATEKDATEVLPDTDLERPMQEILKGMYGEYIIEEEVQRRLTVRREQHRQEKKQSKAARAQTNVDALVANSWQHAPTRRSKVPRPQPIDEELIYQRMVSQLTTFAELETEEELQQQARRRGARRDDEPTLPVIENSSRRPVHQSDGQKVSHARKHKDRGGAREQQSQSKKPGRVSSMLKRGSN